MDLNSNLMAISRMLDVRIEGHESFTLFNPGISNVSLSWCHQYFDGCPDISDTETGGISIISLGVANSISSA